MTWSGQHDLATPAHQFERPVLIDRELQQTFDEVGYVVVSLLAPSEVASLRSWYLDRAGDTGPNPPGAYNDTYAEFSVVHSYPHFRREAFDHISEVLTGPISHIVDRYRPLVANYVNKPAGTGIVPTHQNWAVVDEREFQSVSVWVALVDCVVDNGAMYLMDGSHRRLRGPRGQWSYSAFLDVDEAGVRDHMTPVCVKAGDAVILDDAVLHFSPPNKTDAARLAIQFVMVPDEAHAYYHHLVSATDDNSLVETWAVTPPFFFDFWNGVGDSDFGELVETFESPKVRYGNEALRAIGKGDPLPKADGWGTVAPELGGSAWEANGATMHDAKRASKSTGMVPALASKSRRLYSIVTSRLRR